MLNALHQKTLPKIISMSTKINLCIQGNAANESEWSGTAYYCGKALETTTEVQYFDVKPSASKAKKIAWRMGQALKGKSIYGFQYSNKELQQLNAQIAAQYTEGILISFNQLLPFNAHYQKLVYYIDCTLLELFKSSSYKVQLSESRKKELLQIESKNYQNADAVFIMGSWLKDSLINDYKVNPNKIKHILPGANVLQSQWLEKPKGYCLNIGFVAKDYKRKGLYYLLAVAKQLIEKGIVVKLILVGECPEDIAALPYVDYLGYINKKQQIQQWNDFLSRCHFGALFSEEEALGISVLEFLAAGIPVMGFYHQGLKDTLVPGASLRIQPKEKAALCAEKIMDLWQDASKYDDFRKEAKKASEHCNWSRAATEIMAALQ